MGELLFGTTLLASFLGGVVALLAPCCVSVMLPAYLSTGFRHRGGVVPATLVFGAGVATVILPIGLGATALSRLLVEQHVWLFSAGGALMIVGGAAVLAGWKPNLPMPGARRVKEGSFGSAYALGAFSGLASACCAPVLVGVAVLAGASASFPVALAIGLSYVAGMVAPLALVALAWDRRRERASRVLSDRTVRLRMGRWQRHLALGTAVSGLLMIGMGVLAFVLAFTGAGMARGGWQSEVSAWLQHLSSITVHALSWAPGWALALVLVLGLTLLIRRGVRARAAHAAKTTSCTGCDEQPESASIPATVEENHRGQDQR
ncbi:putative cytochrome c biogenesis protein [Alloactinosynnema sp. L-07]|uniref:cytochrome c biogenesis CcdA family protein n=1 Tax=Alloactinosynnema sp. L-07 TaxID=1653480 RepID=UPI00065F0B0F|nr:cytochrome c biogenesis CcdA family protein [Alloactinosynnema sp. L-07]CRK55251.1 putative cytochrome c biogenesis protein [Alloactinosynnema sp. L-07]